MAAAFLCGAAAIGPSSADAYVKGPPIYTEDGQVAKGAYEWLRDYSDDVAAEFNTESAGTGTRLSQLLAKSGKMIPRGLGAVGLAFGAYEICDSFFKKGCWLMNWDDDQPEPPDGGSVARYGPCVVPSSDISVGSFNCAGSTIIGRYPDLVGTAVYVSQRGPYEALGNHPDCDQPGPTAWAPDGYSADSDPSQCYTLTGELVNQNLGVAFQYAGAATIDPPHPATPDRSGTPNIDVVTKPLPATFITDFGDELALDDNEDIRELMEPIVPRTIPAPRDHETFEAYRDRLVDEGWLGEITRVDLSDSQLDPARGPNEAVRTSPAVGTAVAVEDQATTDISVYTNPATAPDPAVGGGGPAGCTNPSIRAFDLSPLQVDLGTAFPFGLFGWLDGALGGFIGGGVAPRVEIPMPGDIDPIVIDFDEFSPVMDYLHPAILIVCFFSFAYLLASAAMGLGRPTED